MKTLKALLAVIFVLLLMSSTVVVASSQTHLTQQNTPTVTGISTEQASIIVTLPRIVSELRGTVRVQGTVNLPEMRSYFLEWRPLNDDATSTTDDSVSWVPATLPATKPVQAGTIGNWDTTLVSDGLYELRLTVTRDNEAPVYYVVTPLRISNTSVFTATPRVIRSTLTPTAVRSSLLLNGIALNPANPTCGSVFNVTVNVNNPTAAITAAGTVYLQDIHLSSGTVTTTGSGNVPALNPGANYVVTVPLTVMLYYNEVHQIRANIAGAQITANYTLAQGACNVSTTTPPPATASKTIPPPTLTSVAPSATPAAPTATTPATLAATASATP